jgi:aminopeptidase N
VAAGFDDRAYVEGAEVMQAVAIEMGGRDRMVSFLRDLRVRRSFDPFDTWDLADEIGGWSGHSVRERFRSWLYTPGGGAAASRSSPWPWLHQVDMSLPEARRPR